MRRGVRMDEKVVSLTKKMPEYIIIFNKRQRFTRYNVRKGRDSLKWLQMLVDSIVYMNIGFEIICMRLYFFPRARKRIQQLGYGHLLKDSLQEAYDNPSRKSIVLTPKKLIITFKMNGEFGRVAMWTGDQWVRSEKIEELSLKRLDEICSFSDEELELRLKEKTVRARFVAYR